MRVRNSGNVRYTNVTLVPSSGLGVMAQGPSNCTIPALAPGVESLACNATFALTLEDFTSESMQVYVQVVITGDTVWDAIPAANATGGIFSLAYARQVEFHLSSWLEGAYGEAAACVVLAADSPS